MERGPAALLDGWLSERLVDEAWAWLKQRVDAAGAGAGSPFFTAFSMVPRKTGPNLLSLTAGERAAASGVRAGWRPERWTVAQAARTRLLLAVPSADRRAYDSLVAGLLEDADLDEAVAVYQSLPLLPYPESHRDRTADGIRTNIKPVFEAIALDNPYPAEQLEDAAFNQLVLKCLFVGSPLHRVVRLDERSNSDLARMLSDYAHERWAAGRSVPLELWRPFGRHASGMLVDDLRRVLRTGAPPERLAAALAGRQSPAVAALRSEFPEIFDHLDRDPPSWPTLANEQESR